MKKYLFLYRLKDSDDRDCCAYVEDKQPRFECNHYFGGVTLHGACYFMHKFPDYDEIETVLSREEYEKLIKLNKELDNLGYGIKKEDERYTEGMKIGYKIDKIFEILRSEKGKEFRDRIIESEIEYIHDEYNLTDDEINDIFNEYELDYRDRGIIGCVFEDVEKLGYEEAFSFGYIKSGDMISEKYFDYKKFGEDLLEDNEYFELSDGRVVTLNY